MRLGIVAIFLCLLPFGEPAAAPTACTCPTPVAAPCAAYWRADSVFVGRVEAVRRTGSGRTIVFSVVDGIRGVRSSTVDVTTGPAAQRCSIAFRPGAEYVVYASSDRATGGLSTDGCSRTRLADDAAADIEYARALREGRQGLGAIGGSVMVERRDLLGRVMSPPSPAADVRVRVTKDGADEVATTTVGGDFAVGSRGSGRYEVAVDVPPRYYTNLASASVELKDARACTEVTFLLADNGRVTGRVVASDGAAVHGLTVELATEDRRQRRRTITDRAGRYDIARIPAGRFAIRAGEHSPSMRAVVAPGALTAVDDLRLPPGVRYVPLTGFVVTGDGAPAEGARVYLKNAGADAHIVAEPAVVDFLGRFTIAGLAGGEFRLFAELSRDRRVEVSDELELRATPGLAPLRFVVRRRY